MAVAALVLQLTGCATYNRVYDDLEYVQGKHGCIGVELNNESALCIDTVYVTVTIVW